MTIVCAATGLLVLEDPEPVALASITQFGVRLGHVLLEKNCPQLLQMPLPTRIVITSSCRLWPLFLH
jgi:hypothetical protein